MPSSVVAFSGFKAIYKHQLINPYLSMVKSLSIIIPILQSGKLRHPKVKHLAQGHRKDMYSVPPVPPSISSSKYSEALTPGEDSNFLDSKTHLSIPGVHGESSWPLRVMAHFPSHLQNCIFLYCFPSSLFFLTAPTSGKGQRILMMYEIKIKNNGNKTCCPHRENTSPGFGVEFPPPHSVPCGSAAAKNSFYLFYFQEKKMNTEM